MNATKQPIAWNDSLAVGIPEIDEQHMVLVYTLNEATAKASGECGRDVLEQITRDLLAYALYHFETEERLMEQYGYTAEAAGDAARHLEEHRAFSAKVVATRERLKAGTPVAMDEVLDFMYRWLLDHILNIDRKLAAFIMAKRLAGGPPADGPVG